MWFFEFCKYLQPNDFLVWWKRRSTLWWYRIKVSSATWAKRHKYVHSCSLFLHIIIVLKRCIIYPETWFFSQEAHIRMVDVVEHNEEYKTFRRLQREANPDDVLSKVRRRQWVHTFAHHKPIYFFRSCEFLGWSFAPYAFLLTLF